jgi:hypothetical protein
MTIAPDSGSMNRARLNAAIEKIRDYTKRHAELCAAHHFLFDLPLDRAAGRPEYVILGINPGETERDRRAFPGPTEETWNYDFHENALLGRSQGSKNWRKNAVFFSGGRPLVFGELFFWSSADGDEFEERFGPLWDSPHLPFCIDMTRLLIEEYQPKAVIFAGLGPSKKVADKFALAHVNTLKSGSQRLVEHYSDGDRPWFFTKHWSGSFGFSNAQKESIKSYILCA